MPPTRPARCRTQCYSGAVHSSAARKVRRDSRPAIIFNSRCAPIMASRSSQASMVRAFFIATSNTCVRLSIIAPPPCALDLTFNGKNGKFVRLNALK